MSKPIPKKLLIFNLFKSDFFVIFKFFSSPLINLIFLFLFKNNEASSVTIFLLCLERLYKVLKSKH